MNVKYIIEKWESSTPSHPSTYHVDIIDEKLMLFNNPDSKEYMRNKGFFEYEKLVNGSKLYIDTNLFSKSEVDNYRKQEDFTFALNVTDIGILVNVSRETEVRVKPEIDNYIESLVDVVFDYVEMKK